MKKPLLVILTSIIIGCVLMSGGYGLWEKKLTIKGSLTVVVPPPPPTPAPTPAPSPALLPEAGSVVSPEPSTLPEPEKYSEAVNNIVEVLPQSSDTGDIETPVEGTAE